MLPLAPGLLSMTSCTPSSRVSASWNSRAAKSVPPPGGLGTTRVIGRFGQVCAWPRPGMTRGVARAAASRLRRGIVVMVVFPPLSLLRPTRRARQAPPRGIPALSRWRRSAAPRRGRWRRSMPATAGCAIRSPGRRKPRAAPAATPHGRSAGHCRKLAQPLLPSAESPRPLAGAPSLRHHASKAREEPHHAEASPWPTSRPAGDARGSAGRQRPGPASALSHPPDPGRRRLAGRRWRRYAGAAGGRRHGPPPGPAAGAGEPRRRHRLDRRGGSSPRRAGWSIPCSPPGSASPPTRC